MPTNTLKARTFEVDQEGFLTRRDEWSEDLAADLAALIGIELTEAHREPLRFMREDSAVTGVTPTLRRMQKVGGFDIKTLFALYPGKPAKKMAWLAGLPKPVGCV
ncbi:TusE/DsrC/DsvC family sulfur relay protein [Flaviflexus huanghaiensis]|uniref:TusE/DsrC/DsvC family sulfur relay protein n=1 Tax=Flaviflexus huanghaiensis TaxID=1111473 RepID=UPI0015FC19BF|nr:TusE/DsrC/DsvC family sulfur relay protein [Flaviflexus huanghaiensis]